jgi:type III secretory pathway component EscV
VIEASQEGKDGGPLAVLIELTGPSLDRYLVDSSDAQHHEFQQIFLGYLDDFVASLNLPIRFRLQIGEQKGQALPAPKPIGIRVGARVCRVPIDTPVTGSDAVQLARFIAQAVIDDREFLVTEQLVTTLWTSLALESGNAPDSVDPVSLRENVRALVRRGHAFSARATLPTARSNSAGGGFFGSFEETLWAPDKIGLEIALGSKQEELISSAENPKLAHPGPENILASQLDTLRRKLFSELGIILPKVKVRTETKLAPNEIRFRLNDLVLPPEDGLQHFELSNIDHKGFIVDRLERAIRDRTELFLSVYCIDNLRTWSPQLVEAACQRVGTPTLLRVLEGLLREGLSIRDLRGICESLLAIDGVTTVDGNKFIVFFPPITNICAVRQERPIEALDDLDYLSCVRMSMKSFFSSKHVADGTMAVYLVDPELEQRIARADVDPLTEEERRQFLAAIEAEIGSVPTSAKRPAILTTAEARLQLWTLIEREFHRYPVLTYTELSPELIIQPIARISP